MIRRLSVTLLVAVWFAIGGPAGAAVQQPNPEALYQEARRLFDALDYERAVVALTQTIVALEATPADAARNDRLSSAFEMRARSRFGLGDQDGAKADFVSLLKLSPGYALSGQISPRVVALFEETARETVTNLTILLTPATAKLQLDGVPLQGPGTIRVAIGEHVLAAEQPGYKPLSEAITATAGAASEITISLERVSSVIRITTTPADVEVKVDGAVVGRTAAAPGDTAGASLPQSAPLIVSDVATGSHTVELTRECFVTATQRVEVERPDDYAVGPITLRPAVATLSVTADQPGAQVFVDGKERGVAPLQVPDLCEGEHLIELRTRFGTDARRVTVRAGSDVAVAGVLKPAFALVSSSGAASASQQDMRVVVERALAGLQTVAFVVPSSADAAAALKQHQLPPDWLAVDPAGRAIGANAQIAGPLRKDVSAKLAEAFRTQGVASVTMIDGSKAIVALLGAGSANPDALEVALDNPASIAAAIARIDRSISLSKTVLALQVIDVADVPGAVVVGADAASGARIGDVVVQADGKPVTDAAALDAIVDARRAGENITLDLRDPAGATRTVELTVQPAPRLIGLSEQGLMANRILLDLRARLADATDPFEQAVIRLNTAVALARLGDWNSSRDELRRVTLPDGPGVGNGTVQYLLGLAAEHLGDHTEAQAAFKVAAVSDSLLTEDGPPVKELAEAKLLELQKTRK